MERKYKETKCISVKFSEILNRIIISLLNICRSKTLITYQKFIRTFKTHYKKEYFFIRLLTRLIWHLEKWKRHKLKPINRKPNFLHKLNLSSINQILLILCISIKSSVWNSWSLKILAIKRWFPFNFAKTLKGPLFCGGGGQKISTFYQIFLLIVALIKLYCRV